MTELDVVQARLDAAQASYDQALLALCGLMLFELAFMAGVVVHERSSVEENSAVLLYSTVLCPPTLALFIVLTQ